MLVYFTVQDEGESRDIVVRGDAGVPGTELLSALRIDTTSPSAWEIGGRVLGPEVRLGDLVLDGAILRRASGAVPGSVVADTVLAVLKITAGPDAGRTWELPRGNFVIGRSADCAIRVAADVQCSRHHARLDITESAMEIEDLQSVNGVLVGSRPIDRAAVEFDVPMQLGETILTLSEPVGSDAVVTADGSGGRAFSRPPRLRPNRVAPVVNFPPALAEKSKVPFPILGALAPAAGGVVMVLITKNVEFLLMTALSPVIMLATQASNRRQGKKTYRQQKAEHDRLMEAANRQMAAILREEEGEKRASQPDPATAALTAAGPGRRLWERQPADDDFLVLRLGLNDLPSTVTVRGAPGGPHDEEVAPVLEKVPATVDFPKVGVMGIAGPPEQAQAQARWMVSQIATWHAPNDVSIAVLGSAADPERWAWARWLPHTRFDQEHFVSAVALDDPAVSRLAALLAVEVNRRLAAKESKAYAWVPPAPLVVVIDGVYRLGSVATITRLLRRGPEVGVYSLCVEESEAFLPEECRAAAVFDPSQPTRLTIRVIGEASVREVLADLVTLPWSESMARALAPLRLSRGQDAAATLPKSVRLLDELHLDPPDGARIAAGWSGGGRTTRAVIGRTAAGPLVFDLARHGPHGLVAGTTGSGKSELLQTIIASLAVANRPDAMTFVLVDYKGASAFKECAKLPHTVGLVTDLDGHLTERALASLAAELRRREHVLLAANAKDIEDLVRQCERTGTRPPLARLAIVIDEFASLVEELPGFVDGLVDIARRGRSLGIHLVLATQRPAGVISAPIKANTTFRIAMRVTDTSDSTDVIESPLAARIPKDIPGRGYLRVGHEQMTEFQTARVGGFSQIAAAQSAALEAFAIAPAGLTTEFPRSAMGGDESEDTDLSVLVAAVNDATKAAAVTPPSSPWLDPLPDLVLLEGSASRPLSLVYGTEDFPEDQRQGPAQWDVEHGSHLVVAGDSGSGRSTFLRTLAAASARQTSPADIHIYAIDCGNGMLGPIAALPHCAAVASRIETDRVDRLLSRLGEEVTRRQQLLAKGGFSSIADQRAGSAPGAALPYMLLFVDRWEGFTSMFETIDNGRLVQQVLLLMREGVGSGLRVVLAGDRSVLNSRISSLAEQTLVLRLNDRASYGSAGLNPRQVPDSQVPGRALRGHGRTEVQVAVLDRDLSGPAQVAAFSVLADQAKNRWGGVPESALPAPIGVMPTHVAFTPDLVVQAANGASSIVVGVGGDRLTRCAVDLGVTTSAFVIGGPPKSGRSNLLCVIAEQALAFGASMVAITSRPSPLKRLEGRPGVLGVFDANTATAPEIEAALGRDQRMMVLVDDAELVTADAVANALVGFLGRARDNANALVLAGTTSELASGYRGFIPDARKWLTGLLLCPDSPSDGDVLKVRIPKTALFSGPAGRGILVHQQTMTLVQTLLAPTST